MEARDFSRVRLHICNGNEIGPRTIVKARDGTELYWSWMDGWHNIFDFGEVEEVTNEG